VVFDRDVGASLEADDLLLHRADTGRAGEWGDPSTGHYVWAGI